MDMGAAGKVALIHFLKHIQPDTALAQELGGMEANEWASTMKTNSMLADLFDKLNEFEYNYIRANSKTKPKQPKPYPRPWLEKDTKKYGKDPVPISEFWDWWNSKEEKDV